MGQIRGSKRTVAQRTGKLSRGREREACGKDSRNRNWMTFRSAHTTLHPIVLQVPVGHGIKDCTCIVSEHEAHKGSKNWVWGRFQTEPRDVVVHQVCSAQASTQQKSTTDCLSAHTQTTPIRTNSTITFSLGEPCFGAAKKGYPPNW
jgi:hypothetical protein